MKPMNRLLSFVLSCAMVMILCIPAFAINLLTDEPFDEPFVMDIDNGKLFSAASEDKTVAILTNDDLHLIDISISYDPACDEVYHWAISDYPVDEFSIVTASGTLLLRMPKITLRIPISFFSLRPFMIHLTRV